MYTYVMTEPPDCSLLLDEFIEIAKHIAPDDTLVLKVSGGSASIEILIDGYSVFKQERKLVTIPTAREENKQN